jgi:hypothetical protein
MAHGVLVIEYRASTKVTPTGDSLEQGARMIPISIQSSSIFTGHGYERIQRSRRRPAGQSP